MRAAAILGLGSSSRDLEPFQNDPQVLWSLGLPASGEADAVLVFGGDGTIHRHLGPLVALGLPVLVVPRGSGNDFARALGIRDAHHALSIWQDFVAEGNCAKSIDLGAITRCASGGFRSGTQGGRAAAHYFCCVAGVGLDGAVARRANRLPRWLRAHGGYVLSLPGALLGFVPRHITITEAAGDNPSNLLVRYSDSALLAAFANAPMYGGGMRIAPRAQMEDGQLDVCIVGNIGKLKLLTVFPTVYAGRHLGIKQVEYFQARSLRVESEVALDVYADGEYVCQTPIEVSTAPGALKVIVAIRPGEKMRGAVKSVISA
jgi:diacylglycerol kinase (ATP)